MKLSSLELVAENWYGHHQTEVIADWMIRNDVHYETLSGQDLEVLTHEQDEAVESLGLVNDHEYENLVQDLFADSFWIGGEQFYLWTHPYDLSIWACPVGYDPEESN